jgi:hypothetical protein
LADHPPWLSQPFFLVFIGPLKIVDGMRTSQAGILGFAMKSSSLPAHPRPNVNSLFADIAEN